MLGTCDMKRERFYLYQGKLLKLLGVYLSETASNTTKYLILEHVFPLLLLLKRLILELSHPHLNIDCLFGEGVNNGKSTDKSDNSNVNFKKDKALIYRHPQLMANYLIVISKLMTNNKHA